MSPSKGIYAAKGGKLLNNFKYIRMNSKALICYGLSLVCLIIAVVFFIKSLDWKSLAILVFGVAAVLLFRQGIAESKKK